MEYQEFIKRTNKAIVNKSKDEILLNNENRFLRANLILQLLKNTSQYLKFFDFQNNIIFEKNNPFILINDLKFKLDTFFFLKKSGTPHNSEVKNTISFIKSYSLNPKVIIDLGACWGEYSLFLAKEFKKSKIYSIEGSQKNYEILLTNLKYNSSISKFVLPYNLIISNQNGIQEITNEIGTMNTVRDFSTNFKNYTKMTSSTLTNFCNKNSIESIDFIKIDIEGSELKLLNDLNNLSIRSIQIELINYNSIEKIVHFIKTLSNNFQYVKYDNQKIITLNQTIDLIKKTLQKKPTIDIFLIKK